ncbi:MAG: CPBP family intramembrane glutamic endopeptidase [Thermoanaerobaculia bacterium]
MTADTSMRSEGRPLEGESHRDDPFAAQLRGFGPLGIFTIFVILFGNFQFHIGTSPFPLFVPLGAILVLAWARRSHTPWREIGFARPASWIVTIAGGFALGITLKLLMKVIVMPLFGTNPINTTYHYLVGNRAAIPYALFAMIVGAGFGEETVFRGYAFERLGKLFGGSTGARVAIVLLTSGLFALGHLADQGVPGAEQAAITGLVFGTAFVVTGSIWMSMIAHAAFDLTAYWIIYWNYESVVAHLVFK